METFKAICLIIIVLLLILEILLSPRLDITREGYVLLHYGRRKRKYKRLFKL